MSYTNAGVGYSEPTTSRQAAESMTGHASTLQDRVYSLLSGGLELTTYEISEKLGATYAAIQPRLSELRADNKVEPSGQRRKNPSGRSSIVWRKVRPGTPQT